MPEDCISLGETDPSSEWQKRLELAQKAGLRIGLWDWDVVADTVVWSDKRLTVSSVIPDRHSPAASRMPSADFTQRTARGLRKRFERSSMESQKSIPHSIE